MTEHQVLDSFLEQHCSETPLRKDVSTTVAVIADACCAVGEIIALGPLAGRRRRQS